MSTAGRHQFLSESWIEAAKAIRDEFASQAPVAPRIRMNQIIVEAPFGDGTLEVHIDSSSGQIELNHGHLEGPDVTVTVDYVTAKAIFVMQDAQAAMAAFLGGKIRVQGDLTKLMALQAGTNGPGSEITKEIAARIEAITE